MIYFSLIAAIGLLTTWTDIKNKKIYNTHLAVGAILGLIAVTYMGISQHENILPHVYNGLLAFVIGFALHKYALWRGGDAKLYALYAFLMPPIEQAAILFSNAIYLFACSFIVGAAIILPFFLKDIILNYRTITTDMFTVQQRRALRSALITTIFFTWILFPVFYLTKIVHNPIASLFSTFVVFNLAYRFRRSKIPRLIEVNMVLQGGLIIFGFLARLWLAPDSLSWKDIVFSLLRTGLFSVVSTCLYAILEKFKDYSERVPFAPLLFLGCLLSYTPFVIWLTHTVRR